MKKISITLICVSASALLSACGGGSNSDTASDSVLNKYVGSWIDACTKLGSNLSEHQTEVITMIDATHLSASFQGYHYPSSNCSGSAKPTFSSQRTLAYLGPKTVPQGTAEKFETIEDGKSKHGISMVAGARLYPVGDPDKLGADGFPDAIVLEYVFTKR